MVTVDYYSGYWEIDYLPITSSKAVISKLKGHSARYGVPSVIMSDNGPQFSAAEFKSFVGEWRMNRRASSPGYPRSNGKAEAAVKAAKNMMRKAIKDNQDQNLALLELRNTPIQSYGQSPVQLFFQRRTRTLIPTTKKMLEPKIPCKSYIKERQESRNKAVKQHYDKTAKDLVTLKTGNKVMMYPIDGGKLWEAGTVEDKIDDRSYQVHADRNDNLYRSNHIHLRPVLDQPEQNEPIPEDIPNKENEQQVPEQNKDKARKKNVLVLVIG